MFLLALGGIAPSYAINPDEILDDPVLEARARGLTIQLRCLVCQNQSIDDSDAELARDLRLLVRERLTLGDSDPAVIEFVVARYGDFVLLRPPFKLSTLLLWGTPIAALLIGFAVVLIRSRRKAPATALTGAEEKALEALLDKMDGGASIAAPQDNSSEDQIR
jgi:cytochrome c-type biogenesis protein CcmH